MEEIDKKHQLKYLIFAHERSGSSTLLKIFNLHPQIKLIGEPFHRNYLTPRKDFYINTNNEDKIEISTLENLKLALNLIANEFNGFKHVFRHLNYEANNYLLIESGMKPVFLQRKNLLQVVISSSISGNMKDWGGVPLKWKEQFKKQKFEPLDIEKIKKRIKKLKQQIEEYKRNLNSNKTEYYNLCYEDLYGKDISEMEKIKIINKIFDFWNIEPLKDKESIKRMKEFFNPNQYKLNSKKTYKQIPNIQEIEEKLGSDETGWLFQD